MSPDPTRVTLRDIADQLGLSVGTVSRALQNHPGLNPMTKSKVVRLAQSLGYRPNLAARYLSSRRALRIAVLTPKDLSYYYDLVRRGVDDEAAPFKMAGVELEHTMFPRLGEGEEEAFEAALKGGVDGIIVVPGNPLGLRPYFRRASRARIPLICLVTDAPAAEKLASVTVNTHSCGSLVAELMGRFLQGKGKIGVTTGDLKVADHSQKFTSFKETLEAQFPRMRVLPPVENHDSPVEAYERTLKYLKTHTNLAGLYISTGNGAPALRAVEEVGLIDKLTIVTTNLYDELVPRIRAGSVVATLYERPYSQGRLAFRLLHEFLVDGRCPSAKISLFPLLIMKSNLEYFIGDGTTGKRRTSNLEVNSRAVADEMLFFDYPS